MSLLQELLALRESKGTMFQVKVANDDWKDIDVSKQARRSSEGERQGPA
jgi:hypothetical protein